MSWNEAELIVNLDGSKSAFWECPHCSGTIHDVEPGPMTEPQVVTTVAELDALPDLLVVVAERDKLAAEVREVRQHWVSEYIDVQKYFAGCAGYEWVEGHDENDQLLGEHIEQTRLERNRLQARTVPRIIAIEQARKIIAEAHGWQGMDSRDAGHVHSADSVDDLLNDLTNALDGDV